MALSPVESVTETFCFSPLHEGDTSVAYSPSRPACPGCVRFSPLHEGDTSVALGLDSLSCRSIACFSPLHEGDTSVAACFSCHRCTNGPFQSPSRGGHLRGST
ncbi:hypothetical protein SBA4_4120017 [Candidatus Sulfopaludibacter sp. SbA4]|nr:hypothetical protein SBA4_4120017 [Candidatus Sulfopaludibacter sp. SbA4]